MDCENSEISFKWSYCSSLTCTRHLGRHHMSHHMDCQHMNSPKLMVGTLKEKHTQNLEINTIKTKKYRANRKINET